MVIASVFWSYEVRYYVRPYGEERTERGTRKVRGKYEEGGRLFIV